MRAEEYKMKVVSKVQHQPTQVDSRGGKQIEKESKFTMEQLLTRLISLDKQMKQMNKKGNRYWKEMILSGLELPGQSPIWWGGECHGARYITLLLSCGRSQILQRRVRLFAFRSSGLGSIPGLDR